MNFHHVRCVRWRWRNRVFFKEGSDRGTPARTMNLVFVRFGTSEYQILDANEVNYQELRSYISVSDALLNTPAGIYRWHENWVSVPSHDALPQNGRTHGIAVSRSGHIYAFHQSVRAMLVYQPDGRLLSSWGNYPGAHGLTLVEENGEEFFWLTDQDRVVVEKTTTDGKVVAQVAAPAYSTHEPYVPTWVAVNEERRGGNGDIWVADGYGSSRVSRYDATGNYLSTLDGTEGGAGSTVHTASGLIAARDQWSSMSPTGGTTASRSMTHKEGISELLERTFLAVPTFSQPMRNG
jgi:hypothetical protein